MDRARCEHDAARPGRSVAVRGPRDPSRVGGGQHRDVPARGACGRSPDARDGGMAPVVPQARRPLVHRREDVREGRRGHPDRAARRSAPGPVGRHVHRAGRSAEPAVAGRRDRDDLVDLRPLGDLHPARPRALRRAPDRPAERVQHETAGRGPGRAPDRRDDARLHPLCAPDRLVKATDRVRRCLPPAAGMSGLCAPTKPLRIAYLSYRGKPHVGGQGVYTRHLTKALVDLGHHVEVLGGQPYPVLDERVPLVELPSLDIYNDYFPMRMPGVWELKHWPDFVEVAAFSTGTFPEPLAFSLRAWRPPATAASASSTSSTTTSASATACWPSSAASCRCSPRSTTRSPSTAASRSSTRRTPYKRLTLSTAGTRSRRCRPGSPGACRASSPCRENSFDDILTDHDVAAERMQRRARRRRPGAVPAAAPTSSACPAGSITTASADVDDEGPARTCSRRWPSCAPSATSRSSVIGRPKEGGRQRGDHRAARPHRRRVVRHRRARRAHRRALLRGRAGRRAVAVRGLLAAGHRGDVVRRRRSWPPPAARCPRSSGADGETALLVPARRQRGARRDDPPRRSTIPTLRAAGRRRGPPAGHRPAGAGATPPSAPSSSTARSSRPRATRSAGTHRLMLTVDYDRLGAASRATAARPRLRRSAATRSRRSAAAPGSSPATWRRRAEGRAGDCSARWPKPGEVAERRLHGRVSTATRCTCRSPTTPFDRVIASEVLEHIPDDAGAMAELARVLQPGGTIAVTVPAWLPEKVCWALSDEYHAPFVEGGHVRIYTEAELRVEAARRPGLVPGAAHHAHALHSPYWWLQVRGRPDERRPPRRRAPTTSPRVGHRQGRRGDSRRWTERS